MPSGIVTIGGVAYATYGNLSEANAYFTSSVNATAWAATASSVRNQSLVTAARVFERTAWQGAPVDPIDKSTVPAPVDTQELEWPRSGLVDKNGVALDETVIIDDIKFGNFEYALAVINDATVQTDAQTGSNLKVDELTNRIEGAITQTTKQQFFKPTIGKFGEFPTIVQDYISLWLSSTAAVTGAFAGGTDVCSESGQDFGLNNGGFEGS